MILPRGKLHFLSSSAVSLEGESFFWKLAWEPIAAHFRSKNRTQGESSVSKMGFMLKDLKNHSKSIKKIRSDNEDSWCLKNEFCFFFFLRLRVARARHGQDTVQNWISQKKKTAGTLTHKKPIFEQKKAPAGTFTHKNDIFHWKKASAGTLTHKKRNFWQKRKTTAGTFTHK